MKFGTLGKGLCQNLLFAGNLLPSYIPNNSDHVDGHQDKFVMLFVSKSS